MPFIIVSEDITKMKVDAIVNAANNTLLGGGGVDGAIHRAAGPELLEYCRGLGGCETGAAKSTPGFRLPAKYVIHTVGPVWRGGNNGEEALLASCYKNSLEEAASLGCETVAFPLISSGIYGYPKREAVKVAENAILSFLEKHDITVYLSIFGDRRIVADPALLSQIRGETFGGYAQNSFCGAAMASAAPAAKPAPKPAAKEDKLASVLSKRRRAKASASREELLSEEPVLFDYCGEALEKEAPMADSCAPQYRPDKELEDMLQSMDESFSRNLLRRIDASGMTDAECYKRANIDRKLFSKIRSDEGYRPSKPTVLAFAIALRLDLPATLDLLRRAGMTLSHSSVFDVIIEYFITRKRYDVYEINEALFAFDQPLLGS